MFFCYNLHLQQVISFTLQNLQLFSLCQHFLSNELNFKLIDFYHFITFFIFFCKYCVTFSFRVSLYLLNYSLVIISFNRLLLFFFHNSN